MADTLASWMTSLLTVYPEQRQKAPLPTQTLLLFKEAIVPTSNGETGLGCQWPKSRDSTTDKARSFGSRQVSPQKSQETMCRQLAGAEGLICAMSQIVAMLRGQEPVRQLGLSKQELKFRL